MYVCMCVYVHVYVCACMYVCMYVCITNILQYCTGSHMTGSFVVLKSHDWKFYCTTSSGTIKLPVM